MGSPHLYIALACPRACHAAIGPTAEYARGQSNGAIPIPDRIYYGPSAPQGLTAALAVRVLTQTQIIAVNYIEGT